MQREKGWRAPGSRNGRPHGKDKRADRRARAEERQQLRAARSATQQIAALDRRLGPGTGAKRERERLAKLAAKRAA